MGRSLFVASGVVFLVGGLAGAITYSATLLPQLHDVASVTRMPIPGTRDVTLAARPYGLYFGLSNAPSRVRMRVPKLEVTIVPPHGVPDPDFVQATTQLDTRVGGYTTEQVARITVRAPGTYHVHVESREEAGGSFSIGELPSVGDPDTARLRGGAVGLVTLLVSAGLFGLALAARRRAAGRPAAPLLRARAESPSGSLSSSGQRRRHVGESVSMNARPHREGTARNEARFGDLDGPRAAPFRSASPSHRRNADTDSRTAAFECLSPISLAPGPPPRLPIPSRDGVLAMRTRRGNENPVNHEK